MTTVRQQRAQRQGLSGPLLPRTVLYESFAGRDAVCSPLAVFSALLHDPRFDTFEHYWALKPDAVDSFRRLYGDHPRVHIVEYAGARYLALLHAAGWLVNNATFPHGWTKRPGQVYLNTWHGTPMKTMGYDMAGDGRLDSRNVMRNLLSADWLLSSSPFMTETMYLSAYRLTNVFAGRIVEEGFPRVDEQCRPDAGAALRRQLHLLGRSLPDRPLVVYAPTWRGASFHRPEVAAADLTATVEALRTEAEAAGHQLVVKAHQAVHDAIGDLPGVVPLLMPNAVPTNLLLGAADLLVTDYSSIAFDFLSTGRPLLFHVPDLDDYRTGRGLYLDPERLPGPTSSTSDQLSDHVRLVLGGEDRWHGARAAARSSYAPHDDGHATSRVIDVVFAGGAGRVRSAPRDDRPRLALYPGGMATNGITSSALNLLNAVDQERYDITVVCQTPRSSSVRGNIARIDPGIRVLFRDPAYNGSQLGRAARRVGPLSRARWTRGDGAPDSLWQEEWRRVFGDSRFEACIDYSGYGPFFAEILLAGEAPATSVWLHNDLAADAERQVHGRYPHRRSLRELFRLYPRFDRLVSVSAALAQVNRRRLARWAGGTPFDHVPNLIDRDHILQGAGESTGVLDRVPDVTTFVTVGRLSPEKNHARLVASFARVHAELPHTRLVIIGTGPLRDKIATMITRLGLDGAVIMTGQLPNPYSVMARADCFVLSSDYEGQPMVILEARVLGLPVIATAFDSVRGSLAPGEGVVAPRSVAGLTEAMTTFVRDGGAAAPFDAAAYNAAALQRFDEVVLPAGRA